MRLKSRRGSFVSSLCASGWRTVASAAVLAAAAVTATAAPPPQISDTAAQQMQVLSSIKAGKTSTQKKIDSRLFLGLLHQNKDARLAPLTS